MCEDHVLLCHGNVQTSSPESQHQPYNLVKKHRETQEQRYSLPSAISEKEADTVRLMLPPPRQGKTKTDTQHTSTSSEGEGLHKSLTSSMVVLSSQLTLHDDVERDRMARKIQRFLRAHGLPPFKEDAVIANNSSTGIPLPPAHRGCETRRSITNPLYLLTEEDGSSKATRRISSITMSDFDSSLSNSSYMSLVNFGMKSSTIMTYHNSKITTSSSSGASSGQISSLSGDSDDLRLGSSSVKILGPPIAESTELRFSSETSPRESPDSRFLPCSTRVPKPLGVGDSPLQMPNRGGSSASRRRSLYSRPTATTTTSLTPSPSNIDSPIQMPTRARSSSPCSCSLTTITSDAILSQTVQSQQKPNHDIVAVEENIEQDNNSSIKRN